MQDQYVRLAVRACLTSKTNQEQLRTGAAALRYTVPLVTCTQATSSRDHRSALPSFHLNERVLLPAFGIHCTRILRFVGGAGAELVAGPMMGHTFPEGHHEGRER